MFVRNEKFETKRDGLTIRGTKYVPEREDVREKDLQPVIISHGFTGDQSGTAPYAKQIAATGRCAAYVFDFCGGGFLSSSDGDTREMSVLTEVLDLKAVISHVQEDFRELKAAAGEDTSEPVKVVLWGCSQGGFVSALTAAQMPETVEELILFYPALCIPDDAKTGWAAQDGFGETQAIDPDNIPEEFTIAGMRLGRCYAADAKDIDPFAAISPYPGPVLIIHGTGDALVNCSYSERAYEAYAARAAQDGRENSCELILLDRAQHGFDEHFDEKAVTLVREFLFRTEDVFGSRFISDDPAPDIIPEQQVKDDNPTRNEMWLDTRFLLKDGAKHPLAVIVPGGGYGAVCSFIEGVPFAKKLNEKGISAVIVYYRVKKKALYPAPQDDLAEAVREILGKADEWNLDTENYSVWGSSAGAHLAGSFGTLNMGYSKYGLPKPGALVLCYPVISTDPAITHMGTHDWLLYARDYNVVGPGAAPGDVRAANGRPSEVGASDVGPSDGAGEFYKMSEREREDFTSLELHVTAEYPRTYLWAGDIDSIVPAENSRRMARALAAAGVPYRFDLFEGVDHGFGPATGTSAEGWIDRAVEFWGVL